MDEKEVNEFLEEAVSIALNAIGHRSYGARHPELGKMVNCTVCNKRHRSVIHHELVYAKDKNGHPRICQQGTKKGQVGALQFAKKRFHPHPNKKGLQLVQRTQLLFPQNAPYIADPVECMKESRKQAKRQLKEEKDVRRKKERDQQKLSRRINKGLA